jgi:hypothetical protein
MKNDRAPLLMRRLLASSLAAAALIAANAHAEVYKCVDAKGRVTGYASDCPSGTNARPMGVRSAQPAADAAPARSIAEQEAEFRKRQLEQREAQAKAEKAAAENELRARACEDARSYLGTLQTGTRFVRSDTRTGERIVLDDAGYAREVVAAQREIDANCK